MNSRTKVAMLVAGAVALGSGLAGTTPESDGTAGVVIQNTELKGEPDPGSPTLRSLDEGSQVSLGERNGAWYAAATELDQGWLRMLAVRLASGEQRPGDSGVRSLLNVGRSDATVTTGVRGLTADDLMAAHEDRESLDRMIAAQPQPESITEFGRAGGLEAREVEEPDEPPRRRRSRR